MTGALYKYTNLPEDNVSTHVYHNTWKKKYLVMFLEVLSCNLVNDDMLRK